MHPTSLSGFFMNVIEKKLDCEESEDEIEYDDEEEEQEEDEEDEPQSSKKIYHKLLIQLTQ